MLRQAIQYKAEEAGGVFIEVPTKQVKPSQTCPRCGHQQPKTLDERTHHCSKCNYVQDRDIAAAEVMLLWAQGKLPGLGTNLVDVDVSSSTSKTNERQHCGSMKQLGQTKEASKIYLYGTGCRRAGFYKVGAGSSSESMLLLCRIAAINSVD